MLIVVYLSYKKLKGPVTGSVVGDPQQMADFIAACSTKPYNNSVAECQYAWTLANKLGLTTYPQWAKYNCDLGHC